MARKKVLVTVNPTPSFTASEIQIQENVRPISFTSEKTYVKTTRRQPKPQNSGIRRHTAEWKF